MRQKDLPLETQSLLRETLHRHKSKENRLPAPGECFFLQAPTVRPLDELAQALVAALFREGSFLVCVKISFEYHQRSEHDYLLSPESWTGGYTAIAEVWNPIIFLPRSVVIHATIQHDTLELIKKLFFCHQNRQSPPRDFQGVGKPMPEDPDHPMWAFRGREAEAMERVRRHYHEGWDVKVVSLPVRRTSRAREIRMAASTDDFAARIDRELKAQKQDTEILGPPRLPNGRLFVRRDNELPGYRLIWYSEQGFPPPALSAEPSLELIESAPTQRIQNPLGLWKDEFLGKEILLEVHAENSPTQVLIQIPRKR